MSWKNWPYWLKGGVIGAGVTILLLASFKLHQYLYFEKQYFNSFLYYVILSIFFINLIREPLYFFEHIFNIETFGFNGPTMFGTILILLIYFLIGALIGLVYSKIRSKK